MFKASIIGILFKLQNQFKDTIVEQGNATKWANESHEYVSKIYETENLFERKKKLIQLSDVLISLAGGSL